VKRLGFQFKGTAKRQKIVASEAKAQVDIITAIEESNFNSTNPVKEEILVIPLIQPKHQVETIPVKPAPVPVVARKAAETSATRSAEQTLDQLAAAELLADLQKTSADDDDESNQLVIKQTPTAAESAAASQADTATTGKKKAPLLMLNIAPEMLKITNDEDRFKYAVSSSAEDLNVRSEIYDAIPVGQFGAALLRGMGWAGPDKSEEKKAEEKLVAREQRLGLGAQARPPERPKSTKGNVLGNAGASAARTEADKRAEADRKKWEQKAEQRLSSQRLQDEDFVWLRGPAELSGRRAVVVTAKGVPGLDRVRIQLEHSGRILEVGRKECVLLSAEELQTSPFVGAVNNKQLREEQQEKQKVVQFLGLKQEKEEKDVKTEGGGKSDGKSSCSSSSSSGNGGVKQEHSDKTIKLEHPSSSGSGSNSKDKSGSSGSSNSNNHNNREKEKDHVQTVFWLREGIRVKIVSRTVAGLKAYLQKGTVVDVYSRGKASVRLDDRTVIDNVNERHVETIMPATGGACVVLLGEYRGQQAVCLEKKNDTQRVVVQLSEDLDVVELDMDAVAARG